MDKQYKWLAGNMPTYGGYKCENCGHQTVEYKLDRCPECNSLMYTRYVGYKAKNNSKL